VSGRRFLLVGLTGGIATGKSTVSAMLRALGCIIIDADVLAREVVEPGQPAYEKIVAAFGRGVVGPDGALDRKALGEVVFRDPERRRELEGYTHPEIRAQLMARLARLSEEGFTGLVVFDAAVMIESGNYKNMEKMVVVTADADAQVRRQRERDGATPEAAARRIASQMPLSEKVKFADYVIDNSGDLEATRARVVEVDQALLADLAARCRTS
jgi:dephospho-CoA kinase